MSCGCGGNSCGGGRSSSREGTSHRSRNRMMNYVPHAVGLLQNVNSTFNAIVEIAKKLQINLTGEVTSMVSGLLTLGGALIGGLYAGPRGVASGNYNY